MLACSASGTAHSYSARPTVSISACQNALWRPGEAQINTPSRPCLYGASERPLPDTCQFRRGDRRHFRPSAQNELLAPAVNVIPSLGFYLGYEVVAVRRFPTAPRARCPRNHASGVTSWPPSGCIGTTAIVDEACPNAKPRSARSPGVARSAPCGPATRVRHFDR